MSDVISGFENFIQYNSDVEEEKTTVMCMRCFADTDEKQQMFISNSFSLTIECPSTIDASEPLNLVRDQSMEMSADQSFAPVFSFDNFLTKTKACRPEKHEISKEEGSISMTFGLDD